MAKGEILIRTETGVDARALEGRTFQVHVLDEKLLRLYPVEIEATLVIEGPVRCPAIIAGERCGLPQGHEGKHLWANGD